MKITYEVVSEAKRGVEIVLKGVVAVSKKTFLSYRHKIIKT